MAVRLMMLRHAPTPWNRAKRIQGRTDVTLDDAGRTAAAAWSLTETDRQRAWFTSPLRRCAATASALGLQAEVDAALIEMDWGTWDGRTLAELRDSLGAAMAAREGMGLDFRPDGGESPRDVQARLQRFVDRVRDGGRDAGAVTHKGVIRAAISLACDWDMTTPCPVKLQSGRAVRFCVNDTGLRLEETS